MVFPKQAYVKHVTHGAGQFWPLGYNLNKLGRGSLGDASYQISRLYALWFQTRRFFYGFPYISLCKQCDPVAGNFQPQGHNLNKLGRGPLGDATYKISRLYALWVQTRFYHVFPLCKTCDSWGGAIFGPWGII